MSENISRAEAIRLARQNRSRIEKAMAREVDRDAGIESLAMLAPIKWSTAELELPSQWKEPQNALVDCDLFHEDVSDKHIDDVFDAMWGYSQHTFWVLSENAKRLVDYVRDHRRGFGWTDLGRVPLKPGDLIHLDDVYYRNQCGYVYDNGDLINPSDWACGHPLNDEKFEDGSCYSRCCPIMECADSRHQLKKIGVVEDYKRFLRVDGGALVGLNDIPKPNDYAEEVDWMELFGRPKNAMCGNAWLGFSAFDQWSFEERARLFRILRENPHQRLFCHVAESINLNIPYHGDGETDDFPWSPLETCKFSDGGKEIHYPYIDKIIRTDGEVRT